MLLRFQIEGSMYTADIRDCPAASQLAEICPIEQAWERSDDHEYYTRLKQKLSAEGGEETSEIRKNRLYLFPAWNALSINFRDMNIAPFKVVELGVFAQDISSVLKSAPERIRIRCEA